ncbi:MAG: DUF4136 domain-containing protein [Allosphingosinicella sp.]
MKPKKMLLALAASGAMLALSACTTGFPAQVQRFQQMPAPQGQSFYVQAADSRNQGGLEFSQYAGYVRGHLIALGYSEAPSAEQATMVVSMDYGVDDGRERIVSYPDPWGYGGFGYAPYRSRYGYGRWGWYDPFFYGGGFGYGGYDTYSYTVYTSFLDLDINRTSDGQALFEGLAQARSRSNELPALVPNLVEAMFTGFPGNSGETMRITIDREGTQQARGY